jgi:hypothetical protein
MKLVLDELEKVFDNKIEYDESCEDWITCWRKGDFPEVHLAGNSNDVNKACAMTAIYVFNNFELIQQRIKTYLGQTQKIKLAGKEYDFEYENNESIWYIMWLNFLDSNQPNLYEAVCNINNAPDYRYIYVCWVVTLERSYPISQISECW